MFALTCTRFKDCTTLQCCQPCRFPHELGRFSVELRFFFEDLQVACFWACFNWNLLVFGLVSSRLLFFKFYGTFAVSIYCYRHIGHVFVKISSFWACFFRFASLHFYLIFMLIFCFTDFFCQHMLGLFFGLITYFWLAFPNLLACFCKITWHHCYLVFICYCE